MVLFGTGCAWWQLPAEVPPERPRESIGQDGKSAPIVRYPRASEEQARGRLQQVEVYVAQTRNLMSDWTGADEPLERARDARSGARWSESFFYAEEASAQADIAVSDHYARLANEELAHALNLVGLGEAQILQIRAAEEMMVTGNSRLAYGQLRTLNRQLAQQVKTYEVRSGDSLWVISGRPEGYSNPLLWPLIWRANVAVIPNPDRLQKGQVLDIKPHPSADDVAEAVEYARGRRSERRRMVTPTIGEIRRGTK